MRQAVNKPPNKPAASQEKPVTSAAQEAARQERLFYSAILRTVGERQLGRRPIAEITTRDVEAMARACMRELPKSRPLDGAPPGPKPSRARPRPSQAHDRSVVPPGPDEPAAGRECVCGESPVGWRFYVDQGWLAVCSRHMTGAGARVRRLDAGQRIGFGPDGAGASGASATSEAAES